jgi:gluconate 5-dehydrogenase
MNTPETGLVIVVGAAGGIGSAVARMVLGRGGAVIGVDRESCPLPDHERLTWVRGDAAAAATIDEAFAVARESGCARALVMAAFADHRAPLEELTPERIRQVFDQQAVSAWAWGTRFAVERAPSVDASVVHVSSPHAHAAAPGLAAYAMAKAALEALTRAMAIEWGPRGVRCNAVAPGFVPVPRNAPRWRDPTDLETIARHLPLRRAVTADEVAECVCFLAGSRSSGITGSCLPVDAGLRAAMPEWA